jgi:glycosyltransferase involved in cell wall biosynthesis
MPEPRRILLVLDALDMSGVAFSAQNFAAGLLDKGVRVVILAREDGERAQSFRQMGLEVICSKYFGLPLLGRATTAEIAKFSPEIIHAQDTAVASRALKLARELSVPLVVTVNRLDEDDYSLLAGNADVGIIAVSDAILERLSNRAGIKRDRIRVIPNCLNLDHFPKPDFEQVDKGGHAPVIGTYGTLAERKGQRVFMQAAAEVLKKKKEVEFLIMGHGPDKPRLRELARELGIQHRVTFSPTTSADSRNLSNIDLFIEPTFQEGFGLSVLQAMATGIPVIASGVGGIFSLVKDGETGVLVDKGNAEEFSRAICQLLENPARRRELARHARELIEEDFSTEKVAGKALKFFASLLDEKRADND